MHRIPLEILKKRSEFLAAAKTDLKWVAPAFILQIHNCSPHERVRYGITASRKIGNAVKRNFAKRRLRALARAVLSSHATPGTDYVFIAREAVLKCHFSSLAHDLTRALKKVGQRAVP